MKTKELAQGDTPLAASVIGDFAPMSIKEARKVLGPDYKSKSDEDIAKLILELTVVARTYIRGVLKTPLMMYN